MELYEEALEALYDAVAAQIPVGGIGCLHSILWTGPLGTSCPGHLKKVP
jgi:hypothetical protein